jgi:hypothetical protein
VYDQGKLYRMIKLRNPWANYEWQGTFSDNDTESWTPGLKKILNAKFEDDGSFWMSFEDFAYRFGSVEAIEF